MSKAGELALRATQRQLGAIYRRAGQPLTRNQLWGRIGVTPMIGRNDVPGEMFTLSDARALVGLAGRVRLGRVSMWSANRDSQCGVQAGSQVSNTCSGIRQRPLDFTWELGRLDARLPGRRPHEAAQPSRTTSRDNPVASPYPIWRAQKAYRGGEEVVWHSRVYEAKWWTQGDTPDAAVTHLWDTPWRYIGPVLPSDKRTAKPALGPWNEDSVYLEGDRVLYAGSVYRARWWTQADPPGAYLNKPGDAPWALVGAVKTKSAEPGRGEATAGQMPESRGGPSAVMLNLPA
jgi:chitinase